MTKRFAYKEVFFSPVTKNTSFCIWLALVLEYKLELAQSNAKMMSLHGDLEDEI